MEDPNVICTEGEAKIFIYIEAQFFERGPGEFSRHEEEIVWTQSYQKNFDALDVKTGVSGGFKFFSASVSNQISKTTMTESSSLNYHRTISNSTQKYHSRQLWRKVKTTVYIGESFATVEDTEYVDTTPDGEDYSQAERYQMENKYIQRTYGHLNRGKITGSFYLDTYCAKKGKGMNLN